MIRLIKRFSFYLLLWLVLPTSATVLAADTPAPVRLVFEDRMLTLNFRAQPTLIERAPTYVWSVGGQDIPLDFAGSLPPEMEGLNIETRFKNVISRARLEAFLESTSWLQNKNANPIEITQNDKGYVWIQGRPRTGFSVDFDHLELLLNEAIAEEYTFVRVPAEKVYSPLVVDGSLSERGIQEVLAVGESNFYGSSPERIQNIRAGARKFNGLIIPQGEQFSFNGILKSVDPADGFVEELVIKGDDTEKEFGGGVCQVSTTVYRAAFTGGLQIDQRRNHSYAVPYYKPHGLDATIYLGGQDFRFTNDTPGDLLIQSFMEGSNLYFVFYGSSDGRRVSIEGPFVSSYRPAPDPVIEDTTILPPGEMAELSPAHDGFNTAWVRRIERANEEVSEERFNSNYRAWPAKILRGAEDPDFFSLENSTFAPEQSSVITGDESF